ncbi:MAG: putative nucleotidyltransferase substrate binding domain-containing protein, partial [Desulfatiglandales bacterium]
GGKTTHDKIHLKVGPGGMADIEFICQYHQMMRWAKDQRVRKTKTIEALQALVDAGVLKKEEGRFLKDTHRFFKGIENRLGLVLDHKGTDQLCTMEELKALEPLEDVSWAPSRRTGEDLPELLARVMSEVRSIYLRHLAGRCSKFKTNVAKHHGYKC